jgi:hypothetical protein
MTYAMIQHQGWIGLHRVSEEGFEPRPLIVGLDRYKLKGELHKMLQALNEKILKESDFV